MTFPLRLVGASLLAMTLALVAPIAQAATVTVNLDDPVTFTETVPIQVQKVVPGYGSFGPVTLNWGPLLGPNTELVRWGFSNFSGRHAAYCTAGTTTSCALDLTVDEGFVTLDSFFLGAFAGDRKITWSVIDLFDDSTVAGTVDDPVSVLTGRIITVGKTSTVGFRILFGPDGFTGGINDIKYSYARVDNPPPPPPTVPLPAAGWMLLAGIGGLAALRRRRA